MRDPKMILVIEEERQAAVLENDRLRAELANARLERDNIASLNSSLIAELAEARRALLASNDTVLANKKLQEDNAAKDRIIANLNERSAQYERDSVAKRALSLSPSSDSV